jgi:hypothetical protein
MTRILYWNINNFSLAKIQAQANATWMEAAEAASRLAYIVQNIMRGPVGGPIPDIIVVVEVFSRHREVGVEGTVLRATRDAGQGVLRLLLQIRADATMGTVAAGSNWCVVPPINLGDLGFREAVAVFYNATNLQFTGPNLLYNLWGFGQSQPVNALTHASIANYSPNWQAALPVALGRTTNFPGVANPIPEHQLAGEWQYYTVPPARPVPSPPIGIPANRIQFPNLWNRGPFLTRFLEVNAPNRTLNLFAIHTSPLTASLAVTNMGLVAEMAAVPANDVNVVLGDFNVDTFGLNWANYNWMFPLYTCELDPRVNHAAPVVPTRQPYCMTHFLPTADATPFNNTGVGVATDPQHNVYPRYGYMGSAYPFLNSSGAIDNIFTAYGAAAAGGPATNITVINTLTGTPYNFPLAVAPVGVTAELTGGLQYAATLPLVFNPLITVPPAAPGTGGIDSLGMNAGMHLNVFRMWNNFGKVYSTSDHLPLMIDI